MVENVGIIGAGGIAGHLRSRLEEEGIKVSFSMHRNGMSPSLAEHLVHSKPQAVFLAISTLDEGRAARDYILECMWANTPVITCEKGALAYHASVLKPYLCKIGFSAAVGGGTGILKYAQWRRLAERRNIEIHAVLNGTLNFIFSEMQHGGRTFGEACEEAKRLGYAEPGAHDALYLINNELNDIRMKTCVFFNTVLARQQEFLTPDRFGSLARTEEDLELLSQTGGGCRFVVSISNRKSFTDYPSLGGIFNVQEQGWRITGGFRYIAQAPGLNSWLPEGVGNAIHIIEGELGSGGKYTLSGPGAGHEPTVTAMLNDLYELC